MARRGWPVLGGPRLQKETADTCSRTELMSYVQRLDGYLARMLPRKPGNALPSRTVFLRNCGYTPLDGLALKRARRTAKEGDLRELFLRALAGGLQPGSRAARMLFSNGRVGILRTGPLLVDRCILYNAKEKLEMWCRAGGRRWRPRGVVLQPSGQPGAERKALGNLTSFRKASRRA